MQETIVITGIGMATPLGLGKGLCWEKIQKGVSVNSLPPSDSLSFFPSFLMEERKREDLAQFFRAVPMTNPNGLPRVFPLTLSVVEEAIKDSAIQLSKLSSERVGCSVSVSKPILCFPHGSNSPFSIHSSLPDSVGHFLCRELKISGPTENLIAACATGAYSILIACRWLKEKICDLVVAGSVESSLHPLYISGFKQMGVLSDFPCPFDRRRNGFLMAEGGGVLILERKNDALARKAKIYAEILGGVMGAEITHPTAFDAEGTSLARLIREVLDSLKIAREEVDYINLHGTGTKLNDLMESRALKKVFGQTAYELSLSSTKASTGHLLGASGSVEACICALAVQEKFVPPTVNLEVPDPECDLDYTARIGKSKKIEIALSFSFGFGGSMAILALKKFSP